MTNFTKNLISCALFVMVTGISASANTFTVKVSNFQFSPANIPNVVVGDVIHFEYVQGFHTTTCDPRNAPGNTLPAGAASWDAPMNAAGQTFDYEVKVAGTYNYWCTPHSGFMKGSFTASETLPVTFGSTKIFNNDNKPQLKWTTVTEQNADHFSILKSKTATNFTELATVQATGNSNVKQNYEFTDNQVSFADRYLYYIIATVDKDGKKEFSPILMFKNNKANKAIITSITPNPVVRPGHVMLAFNADKEGTMTVRVMNAAGQRVLETQMFGEKGVNSGHLHLGEVAPGTYTIIFVLNGVREAHQVIVK